MCVRCGGTAPLLACVCSPRSPVVSLYASPRGCCITSVSLPGAPPAGAPPLDKHLPQTLQATAIRSVCLHPHVLCRSRAVTPHPCHSPGPKRSRRCPASQHPTMPHAASSSSTGWSDSWRVCDPPGPPLSRHVPGGKVAASSQCHPRGPNIHRGAPPVGASPCKLRRSQAHQVAAIRSPPLCTPAAPGIGYTTVTKRVGLPAFPLLLRYWSPPMSEAPLSCPRFSLRPTSTSGPRWGYI
ncbi:hypothetical protein NDU88_003379 [Pleurodeles waltl]|uniref:Uncharacterized protein n=1 Tax=Pleurodeles waltl TaxID=8319 RepID=A0AAV7MAW0_PLEWA|nr:hypothetical protein NDU88_003379 [Pleurodeles waltl]